MFGTGGLRLGGAVAGVAAAMALAGAAAPSTAKADVTWLVTGTFDDGGTLSGHFTLNQYGFLENNFDLLTTGGSTLPGHDYNPSDSTLYIANGALYVDFQPGYFGDLHITFLNDLGVPAPIDPIVGGSPGPSWECAASWSCYVPAGGPTRYLTEGFASAAAAVPEPTVWASLILGFFGIGAALRGARKARRAAA